MHSKVLPTCLTRNYVSSWGVVEACRELIQNALDTDDYEFERSYGEIVIKSYGGTIDTKNLLLGVGSKQNNATSRGGFSEGLLLALLILARENVGIKFINGDKQWTPTFDYNSDFNCETLFIVEEESDEDFDGVCITLDLSYKDAEKVEENTLHMQSDYDKFETDEGTILLDEQHSGRIYVGGLFVTTFQSEYGFDFKPEDFKLDRDRRSLNPFDIQWQIRQLINMMDEDEITDELSDRIVESIERQDRSMTYLDDNNLKSNEKFVKSAEKVYNEKYSGKLVVSDYEEARKLEKAGNDNVVYVNNSNLVTLIQKSESYQTVVIGKVEPEHKELEDLLEEFNDNFSSEMSDEMYEAWEELQERIKTELFQK